MYTRRSPGGIWWKYMLLRTNSGILLCEWFLWSRSVAVSIYEHGWRCGKGTTCCQGVIQYELIFVKKSDASVLSPWARYLQVYWWRRGGSLSIIHFNITLSGWYWSYKLDGRGNIYGSVSLSTKVVRLVRIDGSTYVFW